MEQRWRLTLDGAPTGIAVVGLDGRWLRVNPALCRMLGRSSEELSTTTFQELTHPDDLDEDIALRDELIAGSRESYSLTKRYLHADGHVVWADLSVGLLRDTHTGQPLHFVSHVHDVTEQRRNTRRLAAIIAGAADAFIGIDSAGVVTEWNAAAELTFGYRTGEAVGRQLGELILGPTQRQAHGDALARLASGGAPHIANHRVELTAFGKDGQPVPIELAVWQADDSNGEIYVFCRDISDRLSARQGQEETTRRQGAVMAAQTAIAEVELSPRKVMHRICERAQMLTKAAGAVIELRVGDEMVYQAASGCLVAHVGMRLPFAGSIAGLSVDTGEALHCADTSNDSRVNAAACRKVGAASMIVAPLQAAGQVVGVLKVIARDAHHFAPADLADLQLLAAPFGTALANAWRMEASTREAMTDTLTGLANRAQALRDLDRALDRQSRSGGHTAVLFIDLDRFKAVNDTHGHTAGDDLLRAVADKLRLAVRTSDTPARYGGDEFLVICDGISEPRIAEALARRVLATIPGTYATGDGAATIGASVGIAVATGQQVDAETLLAAADAAMYQAKSRGGNSHTITYLHPAAEQTSPSSGT